MKHQPWTHTFNKNRKVEVRVVTDNGPVLIEIEEKDLKSMQQWYDLQKAGLLQKEQN